MTCVQVYLITYTLRLQIANQISYIRLFFSPHAICDTLFRHTLISLLNEDEAAVNKTIFSKNMSKKNLKINYFSNILNINQLEKGCIIQKIIYVKKDKEYNNEKKKKEKTF